MLCWQRASKIALLFPDYLATAGELVQIPASSPIAAIAQFCCQNPCIIVRWDRTTAVFHSFMGKWLASNRALFAAGPRIVYSVYWKLLPGQCSLNTLSPQLLCSSTLLTMRFFSPLSLYWQVVAATPLSCPEIASQIAGKPDLAYS